MQKEVFEKNLGRIRELFKFALDNERSDFYKRKYKDLDFDPRAIKSYEEFLRIPFLTKDEILAVPLAERSFVPQDEITHYSFSSGTTNASKITVLPHKFFKPELVPEYNHFDEERLEKLGVKNFLVLRTPMSPIFTLLFSVPKTKTVAIPGDCEKLKLTAMVAAETGIQGIVTTPTLLDLLEKELTAQKFDKNQIKWIWLAGEFLTTQKYNFFREKFPKAKIEMKYGATENLSGLTPRGYQCDDNEFTPHLYHIYPAFMLETVDESGNVTEDFGEILQTDLFPKAFPLIRYKTGDIGKVFKEDCQCGNQLFLELGGRENFDFLRFEGVILYSELIDKALEKVSKYLKPDFEMHVYEERQGEKFFSKLTLKVIPKIKLKPEALKEITKVISDNLYLSSGKNLAYFVELKKFLPLEIELVKGLETKGKKRNIISHLR
jgi:phenylacetate-CoA ligase